MKIRIPVLALLLTATLGFAAQAAHAQAPAMPAADGGVKGDMLFWIKDAQSKLEQLAEATPEAKYAWRPNKAVRTTGEVFMHVAAANFGIPGFAGVKPPEGFNFETYEKSLTKKADIQKALHDSFEHAEAGLAAMSDADLDKTIDVFGTKTSARGGYMLLVSHCHEHLGQSIAYARSNGIVPPWTAKQDAMLKEMTDKKKAEAAAADKK